MFGSARARSPEQHAAQVAEAQAALELADSDELVSAAKAQLAKLEKSRWMSEFYNKVQELSRRLTEWSMAHADSDGHQRYVIATGGGPGQWLRRPPGPP